MKACGITAEYNPFHNGHFWQMEQAKKKSEADVLIVVMSGNFLQRGEPAIVDKWKRAEMALEAGADLVVELPFSFAVQPADFFARGAVAVLQALHCEALSFGAENGTGSEYEEAGLWYHENKSRIDRVMQSLKNEGTSYPVQMQKAMEELNPPISFDLSSPNNQLGFAYARENAAYGTPMDIHVVARKETQYHDASLSKDSISSATAIRRVLLKRDKKDALAEVSKYLPGSSVRLLENAPFVGWEIYWPYLKYQLTVQSVEELKQIYQMSEGLEYRLKKNVEGSTTFHEFLSKTKTKRFTWTRMQRLMTYTLLQVRAAEMEKGMERLRSLRILGFSPEGQAYLNEQKASLPVPMITNINQKNQTLFQHDIAAGRVYRLPVMNDIIHQDFKRSPILYGKN